jgi:hypothetical protein
MRAELCLTSSDTVRRLVVSGVVRRCFVASLSPLRFHAALQFDQEIETEIIVEASDVVSVDQT